MVRVALRSLPLLRDQRPAFAATCWATPGYGGTSTHKNAPMLGAQRQGPRSPSRPFSAFGSWRVPKPFRTQSAVVGTCWTACFPIRKLSIRTAKRCSAWRLRWLCAPSIVPI